MFASRVGQMIVKCPLWVGNFLYGIDQRQTRPDLRYQQSHQANYIMLGIFSRICKVATLWWEMSSGEQKKKHFYMEAICLKIPHGIYLHRAMVIGICRDQILRRSVPKRADLQPMAPPSILMLSPTTAATGRGRGWRFNRSRGIRGPGRAKINGLGFVKAQKTWFWRYGLCT